MIEKVNIASSKLSSCPKPCTTHSFEAFDSRVEQPGLPTMESTLNIYFRDNQTQIETEYELFGTTSIIASIGGSMGLFLGFSCLDSAMYMAERGMNWLLP